MPPRSSLTSSFSITDANNEVVCPLRNQDGSSCRKRCIGEKRYRSMQEHIRRAHPEHYISKLPATEESFHLMINTPPCEKPQPHQQTSAPNNGTAHQPKVHTSDQDVFFRDGSSNPGTPRQYEDYPGGLLPAATNAAAALASLHNYKTGVGTGTDWDAEGVSLAKSHYEYDAVNHNSDLPVQEWVSDSEKDRIPRSSVELPPIQLNNLDVTSEPFHGPNSGRPRDLLPSIIATSPPGRSSTLPPLQQPLGPHRSRKQSITKRGREAQHRKQRSREAKDWVKRGKIDIAGDLLRPVAPDHRPRPYSASPSARSPWDDLLEAATSVADDLDKERTPMPQSPVSVQRASLPPFSQQQFGHSGYQASPLQQALTPPNYAQEVPEPFPSVESGESAENFHITAHGLTGSSPSYSSQNTQIYCAACQSVSLLRDSYACTECICGLCPACVEVLMAEQGARRKCPRCATIGGRFKPFQLDIR